MLSQPTSGLAEWRERRSVRPGRLGRNLVRTIRAGDRNHLEWLLRSGMPRWDITPVLIRAAHETLELRGSAVLVHDLGIERDLTHRIRAESDTAASAIGAIADRVAALAMQAVLNGELELLLAGESAKLQRLSSEIHCLREYLAQLTLTSTLDGSVEGTLAALACLAESMEPVFAAR